MIHITNDKGLYIAYHVLVLLLQQDKHEHDEVTAKK